MNYVVKVGDCYLRLLDKGFSLEEDKELAEQFENKEDANLHNIFTEGVVEPYEPEPYEVRVLYRDGKVTKEVCTLVSRFYYSETYGVYHTYTGTEELGIAPNDFLFFIEYTHLGTVIRYGNERDW